MCNDKTTITEVSAPVELPCCVHGVWCGGGCCGCEPGEHEAKERAATAKQLGEVMSAIASASVGAATGDGVSLVEGTATDSATAEEGAQLVEDSVACTDGECTPVVEGTAEEPDEEDAMLVEGGEEDSDEDSIAYDEAYEDALAEETAGLRHSSEPGEDSDEGSPVCTCDPQGLQDYDGCHESACPRAEQDYIEMRKVEDKIEAELKATDQTVFEMFEGVCELARERAAQLKRAERESAEEDIDILEQALVTLFNVTARC